MTVRAYLYDAQGEDREIRVGDGIPKLTDGTLLWIDADRAAADDLRSALAALELPDPILDALARDEDHPRLVRSDRAVLFTVLALGVDGPESEPLAVHLVALRNAMVSIHDGAAPFLDEWASEVNDEARLGQLDAAAFLGGMVDMMLTHFDRSVEAIERDVDELDEVALRGDEPDSFLQAVVRLRRRTADLRRVLAPQREVLGALSRPDFELHDELGTRWPDLANRLDRTLQGVERARELLIGSSDIYMGRVAHRSNEVVRRLTIVSTVLLPAVVIAGVLGMNFQLPFFEDVGNFWVALAIMAGVSVAILAVARFRRWI
jgi:Mg2+ and Co2+ transporter CorA